MRMLLFSAKDAAEILVSVEGKKQLAVIDKGSRALKEKIVRLPRHCLRLSHEKRLSSSPSPGFPLNLPRSKRFPEFPALQP